MKRFTPSPLSVVFWLLLALYAGFVFTLPVFPSGDGPVHVYYGSILADRLAGGNVFEEFAIKHYFPPYALANYYLAFATSILPGHLAEKTLVCICIILLCLGFRMLVKTLAGYETAATLLIFPFLYHRYLFTGFYSFCLGLGMALFTIAYWLRNKRRLERNQVVILLALIFGLYLAHPLTLGIAIAVLGLDLFLSILVHPVESRDGILGRLHASLSAHKRQIGVLTLSLIPAWYVTTFIGQGGAPELQFGWERVRNSALVLFRMETILPYMSEAGWWIRALFAATGAILVVWGFLTRRGRSHASEPGVILIAGLCFFLTFCWFPGMAGGSTFVGERFAFVSLVFILAAGASARLPLVRPLITGIPVAALAVASFSADAALTKKVAGMNRVLVEAPPYSGGGRGAIFLEGGWERDHYPQARYSPCLWGAAHYFERSQMTLLNTPWFYLPFWMLRTASYEPYYGKEPPHMPGYMSEALDRENEAVLAEDVNLLVGVDCAPGEPDHSELKRLSRHYGLVRMPWSTREYVFYARPTGLE